MIFTCQRGEVLVNSNRKDRVRWLLSPEAVRQQSSLLYDSVLKGDSKFFKYHPIYLDDAADFVADITIKQYPSLEIPYHARWRHFIINGQDLSEQIFQHLSHDPVEKARSKVELAIISVFLDAGAGTKWCYQDNNTGLLLGRSEGLAVASLNLFTSGLLGSDSGNGIQTDNISNFSAKKLADAFQVSDTNPMDGLEGRAGLLKNLGNIINNKIAVFGSDKPRLGHLVDYLIRLSVNNQIPAKTILYTILSSFSGVWPGRIELNGTNLGDCWYHSKAGDSKLVPFHKLSQWLTYSIIEPLMELGLKVTHLDDLTGLAEYRNGGLFVDTGVISLLDEEVTSNPLKPCHPLIVEWRALTICLLDKIAVMIRDRLNKTKEEMPLPSILEGGTWSAGRMMAQQKRPCGSPPISIESDGSVF